MLPHRSSIGASSPRRGRRNAQPLDRAWLEELALRYVARWEASAASVEALLERKIQERCQRTGESPVAVRTHVPAVLAQLVERDYINDSRFARIALERLRGQGRSTAYIRAHLDAKGIHDSTLEELLAQEDPDIETRSARLLARRRQLGPYCKDAAQRKRLRDRHLAVLSRQGFDGVTALQIVDARARPESS